MGKCKLVDELNRLRKSSSDSIDGIGSFDDFKKTTFHKKIKYAPSVLVVNKGKIIAYLDANSDDDLEKYQDVNKFEDWISKYIYFSK